jgi:hypothetical protein
MSLALADEVRLVRAALDARERAYAPYSKFRVGAALLLDDGSLVPGANVENASYGASSAALRAALALRCAAAERGQGCWRRVVASPLPVGAALGRTRCSAMKKSSAALQSEFHADASQAPASAPSALRCAAGASRQRRLRALSPWVWRPTS